MAEPLSTYLGVRPEDLNRLGVLDSIVGVDTNLFLDPHLLRRTRIPELRTTGRKIEGYFRDVLRLVLATHRQNDAAWREARRRLTFREVRGVSIGYGVTRSDGNAIGPVLAGRLIQTAAEIVALGIRDPEIFELVGLFEEGFGADRLSDMTVAIVREDLWRYTGRIARNLNLEELIEVPVTGGTVRLPRHPNGRDPMMLLPTSLLRELPVALTFDDIDRVVATNRELRETLNRIIGRAWRRGLRVSKGMLRQAVLENPAALRSLVDAYKRNRSPAYDLARDPSGLVRWYEEGQSSARANPLGLTLPRTPSINDLEAVVGEIVAQFKRNIEVNGLNEHLYDGRGTQRQPRHERFSQRLFYSVADTYCNANNLDVSREPNAGAGPVDFKISTGYERRVLVEVKLSSNSALLHGFERQLPAYEESEATRRSFYVIIRVTESERGIENVRRLKRRLDRRGTRCPTLVIVDGTIRPAATRRRE